MIPQHFYPWETFFRSWETHFKTNKIPPDGAGQNGTLTDKEIIGAIPLTHALWYWAWNYASAIKWEVNQSQLRKPSTNSGGTPGFCGSMAALRSEGHRCFWSKMNGWYWCWLHVTSHTSGLMSNFDWAGHQLFASMKTCWMWLCSLNVPMCTHGIEQCSKEAWGRGA